MDGSLIVKVQSESDAEVAHYVVVQVSALPARRVVWFSAALGSCEPVQNKGLHDTCVFG
jgi:hypothetical protein